MPVSDPVLRVGDNEIRIVEGVEFIDFHSSAPSSGVEVNVTDGGDVGAGDEDGITDGTARAVARDLEGNISPAFQVTFVVVGIGSVNDDGTVGQVGGVEPSGSTVVVVDGVFEVIGSDPRNKRLIILRVDFEFPVSGIELGILSRFTIGAASADGEVADPFSVVGSAPGEESLVSVCVTFSIVGTVDGDGSIGILNDIDGVAELTVRAFVILEPGSVPATSGKDLEILGAGKHDQSGDYENRL